MRKVLQVTLTITLCLATVSAQSTDSQPAWPRELTRGGNQITIYQPQFESWDRQQLQGRSAVMVTSASADKPDYGIVTITARTRVDDTTRQVRLEDISVMNADFPDMTTGTGEVLDAIRSTVLEWLQTVSLDRLQADLSIAQAQRKGKATELNNTPPKIFYSSTPAVLILVDGEPVLRPVPGTRYQRVLNTPALLLYDAGAGRYYLDGGSRWMTANVLTGDWFVANDSLAELDHIKADLALNESQPQTTVSSNSSVPRVYVSTTPAELIQTQGAPQLAPVTGTDLLYVTTPPMISSFPEGTTMFFSPGDGIGPHHSTARSSSSTPTTCRLNSDQFHPIARRPTSWARFLERLKPAKP